MTKAEVRSLIWNLLPKYDKTNKYSFPFIDATIERALNEMYNEVFQKDPNSLLKFTKGYGYTVALTVNLEVATSIYYTTLPAPIVPFGDNRSGVRKISTTAQPGLAFFPLSPTDMELASSGSFVDTVKWKTGYIVTPTRVEYYKPTAAVIGTGVRMDLIIPFSSYIDTETVLIPEKATEDGATFTDRVLKILGVVQPVDLKDDNSDPKQNNKQ
jgi:hypothetical protein